MTPFDPSPQKVAIIDALTSVEGAAVLDVGCGNGAVTLSPRAAPTRA